VCHVRQHWPAVTQRHARPPQRPVQQIGPPLQVVDISKESGHQRGSREERQCDEALVGQGLGSILRPALGRLGCFVHCVVPARKETARRPRGRPRAAAANHGSAQNKVLVIMDEKFLGTQAYRCTGCQRSSRPSRNNLATFPHIHLRQNGCCRRASSQRCRVGRQRLGCRNRLFPRQEHDAEIPDVLVEDIRIDHEKRKRGPHDEAQ
jgi:hypothetical protein